MKRAGGKTYAHKLLYPLLVGLVLGGCAGDKMADLRQYLDEVKGRKKGRIEPLPEIKQIETYVYSADDLRDPFTASVASGAQVSATTGNGVVPDPTRRKEELEAFPLDSIRMVGTLEQETDIWALVTTKNGTIFRVKPGNYMGQNNGQIIRISIDKIEMTEIIPDGQGGYRERAASLALNE